VVSRCGMPLGYEAFAGNRTDVTTVEEIVATMERRYGRADRIWVMDRGMVSEENIAFLRQGERRYIVGTPKSMLNRSPSGACVPDWAMNRGGCSRNWARSGWSTWSFPLARERRFASAASPAPPTTKPSCSSTSACGSPPDQWRICSEDFRDPTLAPQALTSTTGEVGLDAGDGHRGKMDGRVSLDGFQAHSKGKCRLMDTSSLLAELHAANAGGVGAA